MLNIFRTIKTQKTIVKIPKKYAGLYSVYDFNAFSSKFFIKILSNTGLSGELGHPVNGIVHLVIEVTSNVNWSHLNEILKMISRKSIYLPGVLNVKFKAISIA